MKCKFLHYENTYFDCQKHAFNFHALQEQNLDLIFIITQKILNNQISQRVDPHILLQGMELLVFFRGNENISAIFKRIFP